jgi:diguanylate cyclase (GGDEF)-like protein
LLLSTYAAFVAWFLVNDASDWARTAVADAAYPLVALAVAGLAWTARVRVAHTRARRGWALFAAAMAARALADAAWFWIEAIRHAEPFPSVADVGYVTSYLLMFVAVWMLGAPRRGLDRRSLALDLAIVATGASILVWFLLLDEIISTTQGVLQQILAIGYPVADGLLLTATAALLLRRPQWLPTKSLSILAVGLVSWAAADITWTSLSLGSGYSGGDWLDLVWLGAMVCLGGSAFLAHDDGTSLAPPLPNIRMEQFVPLAGVAMGYAVLATKIAQSPFRSVGILTLGSLVLSALLAARQSSVKRDHVALLARYHDLATYDSLTGLLRRDVLLEHAERAIARAGERGEPVGVLMIDIDHFKQVNDAHGHATGDAVLEAISRLANALRSGNDAIGRVGGDELTAVLPGADEAAALRIAQRLIVSVAREPMNVHGIPVSVTLSIGVSDSLGHEPFSAVLDRADQALYRAKSSGRGVAMGFRSDPAAVVGAPVDEIDRSPLGVASLAVAAANIAV